jgi:hypothetical protein
MVTCDVAPAAAAPTCERAAETYFAAIGGAADAEVNVRVERQGATGAVCSRKFAPNGIDLGDSR